MEIGLNDKLTAVDSILIDGKSVTAAYTSSAFDFGNGQLGSVEVVARVSNDGDVEIAASQTLAIQVLDEDNAVLSTLYTATATSAAATTLAAGTELGLFVLPTNTAKSIKAKISTATAGGSGKVDVFANILP
jgi:surface antigen